MNKINHHLMKYIEAKRHLWNTYFIDIFKNLYECEPLDSFKEIDRLLFRSLVLHPLKISSAEQIIVKPKEGMTGNILDINRASDDNNKYWDITANLSGKEISFSFIDFFEWDEYGFLTLPITKCKIVNSIEYPEYEGREALIENQYVDFFVK